MSDATGLKGWDSLTPLALSEQPSLKALHQPNPPPVACPCPHASSSLSPDLAVPADKYDKKSNWWMHCLTGNYANHWYKYTIGEVQGLQKDLQQQIIASQKVAEGKVIKMIKAAAHAAQVSCCVLFVLSVGVRLDGSTD